MKSVPVESECCDGECNHDDCCGKVEANCTHKRTVPVEKWRETFKKIFVNEPGDWRETGWAVPYVEAGADALERFISQALQAAKEEERKRIAEAMKRIPIYGSDDYTRGAKEMVELIILAIINKHQ